jgi:hypothetical protein
MDFKKLLPEFMKNSISDVVSIPIIKNNMTLCEKIQQGQKFTFEEMHDNEMNFLNSGHDIKWTNHDYTMPYCTKCGEASLLHGRFRCFANIRIK